MISSTILTIASSSCCFFLSIYMFNDSSFSVLIQLIWVSVRLKRDGSRHTSTWALTMPNRENTRPRKDCQRCRVRELTLIIAHLGSFLRHRIGTIIYSRLFTSAIVPAVGSSNPCSRAESRWWAGTALSEGDRRCSGARSEPPENPFWFSTARGNELCHAEWFRNNSGASLRSARPGDDVIPISSHLTRPMGCQP